MSSPLRPDGVHKGRGATASPTGRFETRQTLPVDDGWANWEVPAPAPRTQLHVDHARRVISYNRSPDIPFDRSLNPYRGCEHGCSYCFARPSHAYLGLSPGLDFETQIYHKPDAAARLTRELAAPGYRPAPLALGVNTDAYQPVERQLRLTRAVLEVLWAHRHPVTLVTKSGLIERDLDLLAPMAAAGLVSVAVSLTTRDDALGRLLEPRAAGVRRRLRVIERLAAAGVPIAVSLAPVIPGLTDHELEAILTVARERGARSAGFTLLRLPHEVAPLFTRWLEDHYPARREKVLARLREMHDGKLYDARFGHRRRGSGAYATLIAERFRLASRRLGYLPPAPLDCTQFRRPVEVGPRQGELFG